MMKREEGMRKDEEEVQFDRALSFSEKRNNQCMDQKERREHSWCHTFCKFFIPLVWSHKLASSLSREREILILLFSRLAGDPSVDVYILYSIAHMVRQMFFLCCLLFSVGKSIALLLGPSLHYFRDQVIKELDF
jgi:hypothetical protein